MHDVWLLLSGGDCDGGKVIRARAPGAASFAQAALDGIEGILLERRGETSLVVSVDLIRRSLAVRIKGYDVEII